MLWIYLIERLDSFITFLVLVALLSALVLLYIVMSCLSYREDINDFRKSIRCSVYTFCITAILLIITPSSNSMYRIIGIGTVVEYLKDNATVNQLPDKCIKALDRWAESLDEADKSKK